MLTRRELDVLECIASGYTLKDIRIELGIQYKHIRACVTSIRLKYNVPDKESIDAFAVTYFKHCDGN